MAWTLSAIHALFRAGQVVLAFPPEPVSAGLVPAPHDLGRQVRMAASRTDAKLAEIRDAIDGITRRAANVRAGHVYVISNVGAFGPDMVKIGMTRRLDPMDRIRELGDASVPFHYDVHAMVFSDDAVGLETRLHHEFADRRVNLVNLRREFFRTSPGEVRVNSSDQVTAYGGNPVAVAAVSAAPVKSVLRVPEYAPKLARLCCIEPGQADVDLFTAREAFMCQYNPSSDHAF